MATRWGGPEDLFTQIENAIRRLEEIIDHAVDLVERAANWMGRLARHLLRLLIRGGWQVCRIAAVCLFFVYLTSLGVEIIIAASTVFLPYAAWLMRVTGALIVLSGCGFLGVLVFALFTAPQSKLEENSISDEAVTGTDVLRRTRTKRRVLYSSAMPGFLLFLDIVICLGLYGLAQWPPYRCRSFPLATTQQFVHSLVSHIRCNFVSPAERQSPFPNHRQK
jgi:hypothetical protein